jgi:hypothetical protein
VCNTPPSPTPVEISDPSGVASIEFPDVSTPGDTTVTEIPCTMNAPDGFTLNTQATCWDINSDADSSSGEKIVCITYPNSLTPAPTSLMKCESAGATNCCIIPLNPSGVTACLGSPPPPPPWPSYESVNPVPVDLWEACIRVTDLSVFAFGQVEVATDSDFDSVPDFLDNCPLTFNPLQEDSDFDGAGDVCDPPELDQSVPDYVNTPSCWPSCGPGDFPIDLGVIRSWSFTIPPGEEVGEVIISGTWGDVDSFDSSAPVQLFLDGILVAECTTSDPCWLDDGQYIDWSFNFLLNDVPDFQALFADGEAELTAIQNDVISVILSNLNLKVFTRPITDPGSPLPSLSDSWRMLYGLALLLVATLLLSRRSRMAKAEE